MRVLRVTLWVLGIQAAIILVVCALWWNSIPVYHYYGKIVDQDGQPVPGIPITTTATLVMVSLPFFMPDIIRTATYSTESDADGLFQFTAHSLYSLRASVGKKPGYVIDLEGKGFRPPKGGDQSTPDDRGIFVLWKLLKNEPMEEIVNEQHDVPYSGRPASFSLETRSIGNFSPDLIVTVTRNPLVLDQKDQSERYDWTLKLQIPDGGLAELPKVYAFEAPVSGYQTSITIDMPRSTKPWKAGFGHTYFYKIRDGKIYGRLDVGLATWYYRGPYAFLELNFYFNPSGSRNLQYSRFNALLSLNDMGK
jgi:hypothetical protein